ncbi:MAG: T9SS type A sorting domain-containing protein [Bacteroidales bacterium]|nr:T9SS type A sorting domain-containing protein [Bacteroidales bacterium]
MKKAVFSLLVAFLLITGVSMAQKPVKAGIVISVDTVVCDSLFWDMDGSTYKNSDVVMYRLNADTTYLLNLTVVKTQRVDTVMESFCSYTWHAQSIVRDTTVVDSALTKFGGCDSITTIDVVLNTVQRDTFKVVTCFDYVFGKDTLNVSGYYSDTTRNEELGCASIRVLDLNMQYEMVRVIEVENCGAYTWPLNDSTYAESTTDTTRQAAASTAECDSALVLVLDVYHLDDTVEYLVCDSLLRENKVYYVSGTYLDTTYEDGCSTHNVINLTVQDTMTRTVVVEKCGPYTWAINDSTYAESTTDDVFLPANGAAGVCDTLLTLDITITHLDDTITAAVCGGYKRNDTTYTETGTYFDTTLSASGCATHNVLNLTITPKRISTTDTLVTGCGSMGLVFTNTSRDTLKYYDSVTRQTTIVRSVYNGATFTHNSFVTVRYSSNTVNSCFDSAIYAHVRINPLAHHIEEQAGCDSYSWKFETTKVKDTIVDTVENTETIRYDTIRKNRTFSETGKDSVRVGATAFGCDSFYVLNVTINKSPVINSINGKYKVLSGEETRLYADCDQDSIKYTWSYDGKEVVADTLHVSVNANTDVTLKVENTKTHCTSESWITILYGVGIADVESVNLSLYPNPVAHVLNISSEQSVRYATIYNMMGVEVFGQTINATSGKLNLSALPQGTYSIRIELENGQTLVRKFVKTK